MPAPEVVARDDVRVPASPVRCPFCHTDISPDATDWVACKACLARHHVGCWGEHGKCSSCAQDKFLPATPGRRERANARPSRPARIVKAVVLGGVLALAFASGRSTLPRATPVAENAPETRETDADSPDSELSERWRLGKETFTRVELYSMKAVNPHTGKAWEETKKLHQDQYAERLARMVLEGYTDLRSPTAKDAVAVMQLVLADYRRQFADVDLIAGPRMRRLQQALSMLGAKTETPKDR